MDHSQEWYRTFAFGHKFLKNSRCVAKSTPNTCHPIARDPWSVWYISSITCIMEEQWILVLSQKQFRLNLEFWWRYSLCSTIPRACSTIPRKAGFCTALLARLLQDSRWTLTRIFFCKKFTTAHSIDPTRLPFLSCSAVVAGIKYAI